MSLRPTLVHLTNIPTPYRTAFCNVLRQVLREAGIDFHVLYCARTEPDRHWPFDPRELDYSFTFLPGIHPTLGGTRPHLNPGIGLSLAKLRPRWLLAAGAWNLPTVLVASVLPRAIVGHRLFWSEGHGDAVMHASGPVARVRRASLRAWDGFAVPNARSAAWVQDEVGAPRPTLLLPNTVDETFFTPVEAEARDALRARFGWTGQRVVFTASRLEGFKGITELVEGWASLPEATRRVGRLAIAGDGSLRAHVETMSKRLSSGAGGLEVLGSLTPEQVRERLRAADAFILPSHRDPNPLSPIEAALVGRPLLLSHRAGNIDELLVHGQTGWKLDRLDALSLAAALGVFLQAPEPLVSSMGRDARTRAIQQFTRRAVAERFVRQLVAAFP